MINWLKKQAAAYIIENKQAPKDKAEMELVGVDSEGNRYFTWTTLSDVPNIRRKKIETAAMFADAKISEKTLQDLVGAIAEINMKIPVEKDDKAKARMHGQIAALCGELEMRKDYAIPEELHYQIAALLTIRDDESHLKYSEQIHGQKIERFKQELQIGNPFFFRGTLYNQLLNSSIGIGENWQQQLIVWEAERQRHLERMEVITSEKTFKTSSAEKTSL